MLPIVGLSTDIEEQILSGSVMFFVNLLKVNDNFISLLNFSIFFIGKVRSVVVNKIAL
jgi:hypothetical protein